jgi:hypothetical protein
MAEAAPSCADRVKRAGEGLSRFEGRARASKFRTSPFSRDAYSIPLKFNFFKRGQ